MALVVLAQSARAGRRSRPESPTRNKRVTVSTADFKEIMSWQCASVSVVSTRCDNLGFVGFTATSVQAVCADPPVISFSVSSRTRSAEVFAKATHVSVGLIATGRQDIGYRYSGPTDMRFLPSDFTIGPYELPFLHGTVVSLVGKISDSKRVHDSVVIFADVVFARLDRGVKPLLYHRRGYL